MASFFAPHLGYYAFFTEMAVWLSLSVLGLKFVAAGTTIFSLGIMCLVLLSPLFLPSSYWDTERKKIIIILFSLIVGVGQIWLNTINSQFYLCLFSIYILLSDPGKLQKGWLVYSSILLMVAALTGATSVVLFPFFALKLFTSGRLQAFPASRVNWIFFLIMTLGLLIQTAAFYFSLSHGEYGPRFAASFFSNFPSGFATSLMWIARSEWQGVYNKFVIETIFGTFIFYSLYHAVKNGPKTRYLAALILYISLVFTLLSLGMAGGSRYAYPVSVVIIILLIQQADQNNKLLLQRSAFSALLVIALIKTPSFFHTKMYYDPRWDTYHSQVIKALAGEQDFIKVYPYWPGRNWRILLHGNPN